MRAGQFEVVLSTVPNEQTAGNDPQAPTKGDAYDLQGTVTETGGEAPTRSVGNSKGGRRA